MHRERNIIPTCGIRGAVVSGAVLGADQRGGVEGCGGDGVAGEAENVQERERGRGAGCGTAEDIEVGLGVEGEGPGEGAVGVLLDLGRSRRVEKGGGEEREVLYPAEESGGIKISLRTLKLLKVHLPRQGFEELYSYWIGDFKLH